MDLCDFIKKMLYVRSDDMNNSLFSSIIYRETGLSHIEKGKGCEDNVFSAFSSTSGVKAVSLSDGAGSYCNAAIGSELTSKISAELFVDKFDLLFDLDSETASKYIIKEIRTPLEEMAKQSGNDLLSYSATLLCVALHPDGRFIAFHIGDGAIIGYEINEGTKTVSLYDHDGPATQATFVTVDNTEYNMVKGRDKYSAFVLMSDGPEDFLVNEVEINPRVQMMIQLAYFVSEQAMKDQLASLIQLLNENGMFDDASFAIILDERKTADIFASLSSEMKSMLFEVDSEIGSKKLKKALDVINIISLYNNGATLQQISRQLHVHSPKIAKKKIEFMVEMKLIEKVNGKYYIAK